jgi:hypothetical protein
VRPGDLQGRQVLLSDGSVVVRAVTGLDDATSAGSDRAPPGSGGLVLVPHLDGEPDVGAPVARGAAMQAAAVLTGRSFDDVAAAWGLGRRHGATRSIGIAGAELDRARGVSV